MTKKPGPKPDPKRNWRNRRAIEIGPQLYDDFRDAVSQNDITFAGAVRALMQAVIEGRIVVEKAARAKRPTASWKD
ncbi:MAG: hypothetical protein NXI22_09930 [bacterium]|nr:hypothetical protein [bacterium]